MHRRDEDVFRLNVTVGDAVAVAVVKGEEKLPGSGGRREGEGEDTRGGRKGRTRKKEFPECSAEREAAHSTHSLGSTRAS